MDFNERCQLLRDRCDFLRDDEERHVYTVAVLMDEETSDWHFEDDCSRVDDDALQSELKSIGSEFSQRIVDVRFTLSSDRDYLRAEYCIGERHYQRRDSRLESNWQAILNDTPRENRSF